MSNMQFENQPFGRWREFVYLGRHAWASCEVYHGRPFARQLRVNHG
jgi:hypothetical protein